MSSNPYTIKEVIDHFSLLLDGMDFERELVGMGIKRLHFRRKKHFCKEMQALSIGLWYIALRHSFPKDYEQIFDGYINKQLDQVHEKSEEEREKVQAFLSILYKYVSILREKGDSDFMGVSTHIVKMFSKPNEDISSKKLRLALMIRENYTMIFQHLI